MKFKSSDFPKIQLSAIVCLVLIAVGAGTVHFANNASRAAQTERTQAQSQRNDIEAKFKRIRSEEGEIREKSALYQHIAERGTIGEEQRLEWIELLKTIRDKRKLIDLRYELEPQRPLDGTLSNKALTFFVSPMRVQLELLHEEDLTRFIHDLREQARALIQVSSCNVQRDASTAGNAGSHLRAECKIDWITLREPRPEEIKK